MIFIGYDEREREASNVCRWSIMRQAPKAEVRELRLDDPDVAEVYDRPFRIEGGQYIDGVTGAPFSTQFSYSRFLVPYLAVYSGWHLFVDADFLFRAPVGGLLALADDRYAVMVVKHRHEPDEPTKMDGCAQTTYRRKNWSSLVLWNAGHPSNRGMTPAAVNTAPGLTLHGFDWLTDDEIGELPHEWNYLVGYDSRDDWSDPKAVHFTNGGPWWDEYASVEFADEWFAVRDDIRGSLAARIAAE